MDTNKGQDFTMKMYENVDYAILCHICHICHETLINVNVADIGNGQEWTATDD